MPPLAPWPHRLPPPTPPPPLPPQPPPPPPQRTKKQRHRDRRRSLPSTPSTSLEGKLNEIMQYTDAAPSEMRRHQQMAHAVCRQGEDLVSLVHNADVPRLRERACEAHARYVTARQKLQGRIADPELWGITDVFVDLRDGEAALGGAVWRVRSLEDRLGRLVGELRAELAALRASSAALARRDNADAAEEFAARARRRANLVAYGEWGRHRV